MPDATGLELIAHELRAAEGAGSGAASGSPVIDTVFFRGRGTLIVEPARIRGVLAHLRAPRLHAAVRACTAWTTTPRSPDSA